MKLDPHKTLAAVMGPYLAHLVCWALATYTHVPVPLQLETALAIFLTGVIAHLPLFPNPIAG